jgi:hypothetical protein
MPRCTFISLLGNEVGGTNLLERLHDGFSRRLWWDVAGQYTHVVDQDGRRVRAVYWELSDALDCSTIHRGGVS